jgi:hypothetical protein
MQGLAWLGEEFTKLALRGKPPCLMKSPAQSRFRLARFIGQTRMDPLQGKLLISTAPPMPFPAHNGINEKTISSSWAQKECQTGEDGVKNRDIFRIHIALPTTKQHLENAP